MCNYAIEKTKLTCYTELVRRGIILYIAIRLLTFSYSHIPIIGLLIDYLACLIFDMGLRKIAIDSCKDGSNNWKDYFWAFKRERLFKSIIVSTIIIITYNIVVSLDIHKSISQIISLCIYFVWFYIKEIALTVYVKTSKIEIYPWLRKIMSSKKRSCLFIIKQSWALLRYIAGIFIIAAVIMGIMEIPATERGAIRNIFFIVWICYECAFFPRLFLIIVYNSILYVDDIKKNDIF